MSPAPGKTSRPTNRFVTDIFTKRKRSAVMALIRSHGNRDTELRLITIMRAHGITGWRRGASLQWKVEGMKLKAFRVKPDFVFRAHRLADFVFRAHRLAVFVDGCFWHGCTLHATSPKTNADFWRKKIATNRTRDRLVSRTLRSGGWRGLRIWEHELKRRNEMRLVRRIHRALLGIGFHAP